MCGGTWLKAYKPNRTRARTLPHPSEQDTAAPPTECTKNSCHRTWDGRKSQRQRKPQLLLSELTLDVTCCSADTQQQPGRSGKRRASPKLDLKQEATPKCRQSMGTGWVAQRLCGALFPARAHLCPVPPSTCQFPLRRSKWSDLHPPLVSFMTPTLLCPHHSGSFHDYYTVLTP